MTCAALFSTIVSLPNWLILWVLMFVAAAVGASVTCIYYELRFREGIDTQKRRDDSEQAYREGGR